MVEDGGIIHFRPRNRQFQPPLSPGAFHKQASHYLSGILKLQDSLWNAYYLFREGYDIWQDQCEDIIELIQTMGESVQDFCRLMEATDRLPEVISPRRYPLLVTLHHMNKQVSELAQLAIQFCSICRARSVEAARQRQMIEEKLKELLQNCDDLQQKVSTLFTWADQARFPNHNMANA